MPTINWSNLKLLNTENINEVEERPGIYRLSYKSADGNIYVFFVGSSNDSLKQSLSSYLAPNTIDNPCIKSYLLNLECYFKFSIIEDSQERQNICHTLYIHYAPKCNLEIPAGDNININYS